MGFADLAALMEFHANNPDAPNKPVAVMMVYNDTPASVMALKKSGIKTPADLSGKKMGAPVFDAGRRAFPIFAKANKVNDVQWISMDPPLRETMLVRGDLDAITGFTFTSLLNLEARGVKAADVVVLPYPAYGVKLYGNAIIASPKLLKENPEAVKAFLMAFTKGVKDVVANPKAAIADVKERDGIINAELETRRLQLAIDTVINTPNAHAEGFGQVSGPRLTLMASQVSDAFNTKSRVNADAVWSSAYLPSKAALNVLAQEVSVATDLSYHFVIDSYSRNKHGGQTAFFMDIDSTTPASPWFVEFQDVWLAYNEELHRQNQFAVEAIDLKVRQGEFIAIVGPSGCGKSTFMKLATGLKMPSIGKIRIDGQPVTGPLKISGMAFQASSLLPWRTTLDNVSAAAGNCGALPQPVQSQTP